MAKNGQVSGETAADGYCGEPATIVAVRGMHYIKLKEMDFDVCFPNCYHRQPQKLGLSSSLAASIHSS